MDRFHLFATMARSLSRCCTKLRESIVQWFCCPRGILVRGPMTRALRSCWNLASWHAAVCVLSYQGRVRTRRTMPCDYRFRRRSKQRGCTWQMGWQSAWAQNASQLADHYATRKLYLTCLRRRCQCRVSSAHSSRSPAVEGDRSTRSRWECLHYAAAPCGATMRRGSGRWRGSMSSGSDDLRLAMSKGSGPCRVGEGCEVKLLPASTCQLSLVQAIIIISSHACAHCHSTASLHVLTPAIIAAVRHSTLHISRLPDIALCCRITLATRAARAWHTALAQVALPWSRAHASPHYSTPPLASRLHCRPPSCPSESSIAVSPANTTQLYARNLSSCCPNLRLRSACPPARPLRSALLHACLPERA